MRFPSCVVAVAIGLLACDHGSSIMDAANPNMDSSADASDAAVDGSDNGQADVAADITNVSQLPVTGTPIHVTGLTSPVDVVVDTHGWPHIYASTLSDAMTVEGYLVARDRMAQMELIRRSASGTLAQAFGFLSSSLVDQDIAMRVIGLRRVADQVLATTPPGRLLTALQAYSAGVNAYLAAVRAGTEHVIVPLSIIVNSQTQPWTPTDSLVVGWFQNFSLSYGADDDIAFTQDLTAATATFDNADPIMHPDLAARSGFFWDTHRFASPSTATVIPDFYTTGGMGGSGARPTLGTGGAHADPTVLARARSFSQLVNNARRVLATAERGSNNWVVSAVASANGHAMLENDPHTCSLVPRRSGGACISRSPAAPAALARCRRRFVSRVARRDARIQLARKLGSNGRVLRRYRRVP